jgi:spermidine/putrescine transport system ATP-binding protein
MQLELKRIQREVGITFLYVTHDQAEAMSMADRLGVMNAGLIEDMGAPDRVYDHPATRFVAEFLGTCNVLPLTTDGKLLKLPDGSVVEVTTADLAGVHGSGARVGIRPEKLVISRSPTITGNRLSGVVTSAVYLGANTEYEVLTQWGETVRAFAQNVGDETRALVGEAVTMTWDPANCFILPAEEEVHE